MTSTAGQATSEASGTNRADGPASRAEDPVGRAEDPVGRSWQAVHIFYAANPQPLLVQCVAPLVARLTDAGLIDGHFFINYWLEGPHVRLRLRPVSEAAVEQVRAATEAAIEAFLARRPALYEMGRGYLGELYNKLFELEYPQGPPPELVGPDGQMLLRPNNSFGWRPYEPEYGKYGGPAGVALAEWHFQRSSDLVLAVLRDLNVHLRPIMFGVAAQLMMVMAGCFLSERRAIVSYLDGYHRFWHRAFAGTNFIGTSEYERMYDQMAPALRTRFAGTLDALEDARADGDAAPRLPGFLRGWARHCWQLAAEVRNLAEQGELRFDDPGGGQRREPDPQAALLRVLSPYMHMTNNRFHVTIRDEAYLSYVLGRALSDTVAPPSPAVTPPPAGRP